MIRGSRRVRRGAVFAIALITALCVAGPLAANAGLLTETEPNDTKATADGYLASNTQIQGSRSTDEDQDYYKFYVGRQCDVQVDVAQIGNWTLWDGTCYVHVVDSSGHKLYSTVMNQTSYTPDTTWKHRLPVGVYYVTTVGSFPDIMATGKTYGVTVLGADVTLVRPSTPVSNASIWSHSKSYTVSGTLNPRHLAGSSPVVIYKYRKDSKGHWIAKGFVLAKASDYNTISKYATSVRLSTTGKWRLRTYHPGLAGDRGWSSGYKYVTVK